MSNKNDKNEKKNKVFDIKTKRLFLTYSRCPEHWTKNFVANKLVVEKLVHRRGKEKYKTKVTAWVISRETHGIRAGEENNPNKNYDRGNHHFHCLLEADQGFRIKQQDYLDIEDESGNIVHGNYQSVINIWSVLNYVKKQGDWIGAGFPGINNQQKTVLEATTDMDAKVQLMNKMKPKELLDLRKEYQEQYKRKIKIKDTNTRQREIEIQGFPFQKDLEPYLKQLVAGERDIAGFSIEGRAMGMMVYGEPLSGKSTWLYKLGELLGESKRSFNEFRTMSCVYQGETIIMLDEFEGKEFKKYAKQIKLMITDETCTTLGYQGSKQLVWPRRLMICTNEDVEQWEWTCGLAERFIVVKVSQDGRYQTKLWENNKLVNKKLEEIMTGLGFETKEVKEMNKKDLANIRNNSSSANFLRKN